MITFSEARAIYEKQEDAYFFSRDTMRYWGCRIESGLYKNRCFITSENNFDGSKRGYTVRRFSEDFKRIDTIGIFQEYSLLSSAREAAKKVV